MKAFAVIGSAWGDEGKGMAVDAIASRHPEAMVVRHSGGSNCGHTVELLDGRRHIFSHFGSGTLAGCPTYLGEHFVVNVRCFVNELRELQGMGLKPKVFVHPNALVTTPLDVEINRALERRRGDGRHGSVGIGLGETMERSTRGPSLTVADISHDGRFTTKTVDITLGWDIPRCEELDIEPMSEVTPIWVGFVGDIMEFLDNVTIATPEVLAHDVYIFEGNQGLLLDQKRGVLFPYLTRSNTGLQNVIPMCEQLGIDKLKVVYMSRPYLTRHGAGPLPRENLWESKKTWFKIVDKTNLDGEWQGKLRFSPMNKALIKSAIWQDLKEAVGPVALSYYNGYSCLDQVVVDRSRDNIPVIGDPALYGFGPSRDKYEVEPKFIGG